MPAFSRLKADARSAIRGRTPSVFLIALVYLLAVYAILFLSHTFNRSVLEAGSVVSLYADGVRRIHPSLTARLWGLLMTLLSSVLYVGFCSVCLNISRGREAGFARLLDGFGNSFSFVWLQLLIKIFIWLWGLLLVVPGLVASYSYRMAKYIMLDNPEYSARECIRRSKEMMNGHKLELFRLDLSLLGWTLLLLIPFAGIYAMPYVDTVNANFYNHLSGRNRRKAHKAEKARV